jgi:hypothetical protein
MAITVDIVGVGPVEFPDGMSKEAMEAALQKLPSPKKAPPPTTLVPSNQSNYVTGDVPSVVGQYARPTINQPEPTTSMMDKVKAVYEVPATIASGVVSQPVSMLYGAGRSAIEGAMQGQMPNPEAQNEYYRQARRKTQFVPSSPASVNVLENIGDALEASKLPPYIGKVGIGQIPSFTQAAGVAKPFVQEALRTTMESTKPVVNSMANALRTTDFAPKGVLAAAPSAETLAADATKLYAATKTSGTAFNPDLFGTQMGQIGKDLRELGYHPKLHPDIKVALQELTNTKKPKDMLELQSLREFIVNGQGSKNPKEKMLATVLKDKFDDFVINAGPETIISGSPEGAKTWQQARDTYSRLRKSEIFTDMLDRSEIDKAGMGVEKSLTNQLRALAKDPKKMRMFTPDEQAAITQAAKGGNVQNILSQFGRFAPTSAVSSIPSILATAASAPLGLAATAGAIGSRMASTKMKQNELNKLAAVMRAGSKSPKKSKGKQNE